MRVFAVFAAFCAAARAADVVPCGGSVELWPNGAPFEIPGAVGPEVHQKLTNPTETHVLNVTKPTITRFCADRNADYTRAAVVISPGGAYSFLTFDKEGTDVAAKWNAMGIDAYVLKYRVPVRPDIDGLPKWWAPLQDAQRAVGYIRGHAAALDLEPNRIGFSGFSAGGHLTGHISSAYGRRIYPRQDALDDVSCRPDFAVFAYAWFLIDGNRADGTVLSKEVANITADTPPAFMVANQDDTTAPYQNSMQWNLHLAAAGVTKNQLEVDPDGGHGFGLCQQIPTSHQCCTWPERAKKWLVDTGRLG